MWHKLLKNNFTDIDKLLSFLEIDDFNKKHILSNSSFCLNIPYRIAQKIEKNNTNDPLFKQFVPSSDENIITKGFSSNPLKDEAFQKNNIIQKYKNRALLICSDNCAMNCRFCFRQNFKYRVKDKTFKEEFRFLKSKNDISELILSGGDPLILENSILRTLINNLDKIPHIKRIRFHTRLLTALPERIDEELITILQNCNKQIIFALHVNHPNELDEDIFNAISKLQSLNIPFLTQTVLLKGVNDNSNIFLNLFETLSNHGIIPYYLHQLDKVQGAAHFEVPIDQGKKILKSLRAKTSGYNIPSYVQEIPHEKSKSLLQ